jgi:hypothetical protein
MIGADVVQRFFNEARAATMIRHPGIIEVYDFAGDYRYGAFWEKSGTRLRFFVPRNGVPTGAPVGFDRLRAIAAYIDVTP